MNTKRSLPFVVLTVISWLSAYAAEPPTIPEETKAEIRKRVDNLYSTAIVAGVLDPNGVSYFSYGTMDLDQGGTVNEDTLFQIAGLTKTFTTTLLADMAERGEVGLTNLIQEYLPVDVPAPVYGPNQIGITLLHLATHRSGLPSYPNNMSGPPLNPLTGYTLENMYQFLGSFSLTRAPGSAYVFSNFGIGLLGQLLAGAKKTNFETLLQQRVLDVLGLKDTVFQLSPDQQRRFATPYSGVFRNPPWEVGVLAPTAGLRSTARDLLQYLAANMGLVQSPLYRAMTNAHNPVLTVPDGTRIGLAWIRRTAGSVSAVEITGNANGTAAYAGFIPSQQRAVVLLAMGHLTAEDLGRNLLSPSLGSVSATAYFEPMSVSTRTLRNYVGTYEGPAFGRNDSWQFSFDRGHLIVAYSWDQGYAYTLYPIRTNMFRTTPAIGGVATFRYDAQGQVTGMQWSQNSYSTIYPKTANGSMPPELALTRSQSGAMLELIGNPGSSYTLEWSADLRTWSQLAPNVASGTLTPISGAEPMRFYRARE